MKKVLAISLTIIVVLVSIAITFCYFTSKDSRISNDAAEKAVNNSGFTIRRYLTIINDTDQIINEVVISVGEGTEIEEMHQSNPDEKSFSIRIPRAYNRYDTFTITIYDRYGLKYEKVISGVGRGRTEVKFTSSDYVHEAGDFSKKFDKFFNGD